MTRGGEGVAQLLGSDLLGQLGMRNAGVVDEDIDRTV